ncbi:energy transducer TonB [Rodentibacter caecimuris]|uniref:Protein TonB n=1 Tax=Rodentibacter caecimuris TaxID=1796644 RepID=A0ABX3KYF2_9PAST|nr:hypothetical protein BKG89_04030 [Rodentibacter heylii]
MQTKRSLVSLLISISIHCAILGAILKIWYLPNNNGQKEIVGEVSTYISMEMLQGMRIEENSPEPEPEVEKIIEQEKQEIVADPTKKQEIVKKEPGKPKQIEPEKPKQKLKPKEKMVKRQENHKPLRQDLVIGDRDINSVAKNNSKALGTGASVSNNAVDNSGNANEIANYRSAIRKEIERHKRYPIRAKMMRKQGIVTVTFNISAEGVLSSIQVIKSSGEESLDQAAIQAVKNARSVGPKPVGMPGDLSIPINFAIGF